MNRIEINADEPPLPPWTKSMKNYALKVLRSLGRDNWDLSILLCGDKTICKLNARYRGKPEATDVLSFNMSEGIEFPDSTRRLTIGDIIISLDTLKTNAARFSTDEDEELRRLLIHGILHLDGMNHKTNGKTEPMLQLQESILSELAQEHILGRIA